MRRALRGTAVLCALISVSVWLAFGANRGWTKSTRTQLKKDPVTEIDYPVVEKHFSPGVDLLGIGLVATAALAAVSFAFKTKNKH